MKLYNLKCTLEIVLQHRHAAQFCRFFISDICFFWPLLEHWWNCICIMNFNENGTAEVWAWLLSCGELWDCRQNWAIKYSLIFFFVKYVFKLCWVWSSPWTAGVAVCSLTVKLIIFVRVLRRGGGQVITATVIGLEGNAGWEDFRCVGCTEHCAWWIMAGGIVSSDRQQVHLCLLREL